MYKKWYYPEIPTEWLVAAGIFLLIFLGLWIWMMVYATRKKGLVGFLLVFFLGIIGWIIVLCLPADNEAERERAIFAAEFAISNIEVNYWAEKPCEKEKYAVFV